MENTNNTWIPLEATHPTQIIVEELKARGLNRKDMAARLGMKQSNFSRMIKQKETITPQMANRLEEALAIPASLWLNLQAGYDKDIEAIKKRDIEETTFAEAEKMISKFLNLPQVLQRLGLDGYYFAKDRIQSLYRICRIDSIEQLMLKAQPSGCFKRSEKSQTDEKNLNAWILLAYASCMQQNIEVQYHAGCIDTIAKDIATEANKGTITESFIQRKLNEYGIGYCYTEKLPKTPVDAYSMMMNGTPYIVTSHRHDNMDMLVFDVLHELHHVDKDLVDGASNLSCNGNKELEKDARELAANQFAEDTLIPRAIWNRLMKVQSTNINPYNIHHSIVTEAQKYGISPSIATWRYKHQTKIFNIKGHKSPSIR